MNETEQSQWDLVAGQWSGAESSSSSSSLVKEVIEGNYCRVLRSETAKDLLRPFASALGSWLSSATFSDVAPLDFSKVRISAVRQSGRQEELQALAVAAAALHAFIQLNWTGPDLEEEATPLVTLRSLHPDVFPPRSVSEDEAEDESRLTQSIHDASLEALTWAGEPAYHLCAEPFWLLLSKRILAALQTHSRDGAQGELETSAWWRLRAAAVHSRILDTPVPVGQEVMAPLAQLQERLEKLRLEGGAKETRWRLLSARLFTERGLALQRVGADREGALLFVEAAKASGLRYEVTGALGKRTKFQKEEKTILVLAAKSQANGEDEKNLDEDKVEKDEQDELEQEEFDEGPSALPNEKGWKSAPDPNAEAGMPAELRLNDDTLLERTKFSSSAVASSSSTPLSSIDPSKPSVLHPLDSCILLALSLNIDNTSPKNGLTASEISAFVARVLSHARNWSVHTMALLLRSRLEASRTRTAERAVLQLQALLDQMPTSDSTLQERILYFHQLDLPSKWEMQAELAKRYAALGVVRSALEIFERIQLWEHVVQCLGALGRQTEGVEVVQDLLEGKKTEAEHAISQRKATGNEQQTTAKTRMNAAREAKLWCLLGDMQIDEAQKHYRKAWDVSRSSSARAARSLAGVLFAVDDLEATVLWLRRALKINPLYTRSWFMLGCAYMRLESWEEAARCFRRNTNLDDEDGEAWNNLASAYLRLGQGGHRMLDEALEAARREEADEQAVLAGLQENDDDTASEHSQDSGVAVSSNDSDAATERGQDSDEDDEAADESRTRRALGSSTSQSPFELKMLAHRALARSLRLSHEDWRIWNNYMIVSVDCGLMGEAARALIRVSEIREGKSSRNGTKQTDDEIVDIQVLNRLVDAVTRAPSKEEDAVEGESARPDQANHSAHEGHGLYPRVLELFKDRLLVASASSTVPDVWRAHARLMLWRGEFRTALESHLNAWRVGRGSEVSLDRLETGDQGQQAAFSEAVDELEELCELLENLGPREVEVEQGKKEPAMANWAFKARSLVRGFLARTKEAHQDGPGWERLESLRESLKQS